MTEAVGRPSGARRNVVAIGASAGGLNALTAVLSEFPEDLPACVFVVQHLDPKYPSHMAEILKKRCRINVVEAQDEATAQEGIVYFAPPDRHMLVEEGAIRLTKTELVHFVRPSVDLLLESVAATYGPSAIGVILTGSGSDGALGITAIGEKGGLTIVQDPESADSNGMPNAAVATGAIEMVLPLEEIGMAIVKTVMGEEPNA